MSKIFITGATDGIGLEVAKKLSNDGHDVIVHGRSAAKLEVAQKEIGRVAGTYLADLSDLDATREMAQSIARDHAQIDVLINNAGVYKTSNPILANGHDIRFVVNTLAPYILAKALVGHMPKSGRVVNLSSAAQASVDLNALRGEQRMADFDAYAQSKLAITLWSFAMSEALDHAPMVVSVNPGSLLATKMVKEGFGVAGHDINIGRDIIIDAALGAEFEGRGGQYYDNDAKRFEDVSGANAQALEIVQVIEELTA